MPTGTRIGQSTSNSYSAEEWKTRPLLQEPKVLSDGFIRLAIKYTFACGVPMCGFPAVSFSSASVWRRWSTSQTHPHVIPTTNARHHTDMHRLPASRQRKESGEWRTRGLSPAGQSSLSPSMSETQLRILPVLLAKTHRVSRVVRCRPISRPTYTPVNSSILCPHSRHLQFI